MRVSGDPLRGRELIWFGVGAHASGTAERDVVEAAPFAIPRDYIEAVRCQNMAGVSSSQWGGTYLDLWALASVLSTNAELGREGATERTR